MFSTEPKEFRKLILRIAQLTLHLLYEAQLLLGCHENLLKNRKAISKCDGEILKEVIISKGEET
jgi:hypothetical protein